MKEGECNAIYITTVHKKKIAKLLKQQSYKQSYKMSVNSPSRLLKQIKP